MCSFQNAANRSNLSSEHDTLLTIFLKGKNTERANLKVKVIQQLLEGS